MSVRALVALGDVNNVRTFSGTPLFFLRAGQRNGLFGPGVALHPERFRGRRLVWNLTRPLLLQRPGGYQYSRGYLRSVWDTRDPTGEISEYISHFQLVPPLESVRVPVTFYVDATLKQNFDDYGYGRNLGNRIRVDALAREREAYLGARYVVCMSQWCADSVVADYGIGREDVHVVLPGANIEDQVIPPAVPWAGVLSPLRLGLVGEDWERKGGPVLLDVADRLERRGHTVEVVVVGPNPARLPSHPSLRAVGFVHKAREPGRFVELVRSFHFGCLLSRAEASGMSILESLRLGVPVIRTSVGGIADAAPPDAGFAVPVEKAAAALTELLAELLEDPARYGEMRAAAQRVAPFHSWDRTAVELRTLLDS